MWSFSAHRVFRKCPRQWFYKSICANALAKDPVRHEAYRLSKLQNIHAWRGQIVDTVISDTIVPSLTWRNPCSITVAKRKATDLFTSQRTQRSAGNGLGGFFEKEYSLPLTEEMFINAHREIDTALENFYALKSIWARLTQASALLPQRALSFKQDTVSVRVVPDLIAFQAKRVPAILDWKVNVYPMHDYWLQLVTGALALTHCTPHRDWPTDAVKHNAHNIELLEVQLLTGDVRTHSISEADISELEDFISISAGDMELACGGNDRKHLRPEEFSVTSDPKTCQTCSFRKLCWGAAI